VLLGCDGAKRQRVAGALGLHGLRAIDGFDNLSTDASGICVHVAGDVMGKAGDRPKVRAGLYALSLSVSQIRSKHSAKAYKTRVLCVFVAPLLNHKKLARMG